MPAEKLKAYLESNNVKYSCLVHRATYTALETAHEMHVPERSFAKPVLVKIDGVLSMVVVPASEKVDLHILQRVTHSKRVELAGERDFKTLFPDCELGAEPPFGNLYGLPVFISRSLASDERIAFNAGTHDEMIEIPYQAYETLVSPQAIPYPV